MPILTVANRYLQLAPVIVTSPTARCGTTLVQRLLTTSDNAFVYGEEVGHQIRTVTVWLIGLLRHFDRAHPGMNADFERALAGTLADWRPGLTAPAEVMRAAWTETFYQLPSALSEFSRSVSRPVWGFKFPSYDRDTLKAFLSLMPRARVIYLIRNVCDALSSAKARRFVIGEEDTGRFCAVWAKNMREIVELGLDQRVLFVKYEDLLARPEEHLQLLAQFTGAQGIDPKAFDLKVNTFEGAEAEGFSPTQYIAPEPLTESDRAIIMAKAGPVLTHLYADPFRTAA